MKRMSRIHKLSAGVLAATYAALLLLVAVCSAPQHPASVNDHHGGHAAHSLLCAWACQAASDERYGVAEAVVAFRPLILVAALPHPPSLTSIDPTGCSCRAPPQSA
jgi:hypothetical protein